MRALSILGSLYELFVDVLTNRSKKVVGKMVSCSRNVFVGGRQILDASFITNEAIDLLQKSNVLGLICQVNIEKACDNVTWKFCLFFIFIYNGK